MPKDGSFIARLAAFMVAAFCLMLLPTVVLAAGFQHAAQVAPQIGLSEAGATVQDVTIETYGVIKDATVRQYLTLHQGSALTQFALDHDFNNLVKLGGYRVRVAVSEGTDPNTVTLHWIVMSPWFQLTAHPFFAEAPLADPTRGIGVVATSPEFTNSGDNFAIITSQNRWAHHYNGTFTAPLHIDAASGRESDFIVNVLGQQNAFRVNYPQAVTVYNWTDGLEEMYLLRGTHGTQFEVGLREEESRSNRASGIMAPSVYPSSYGPAHSNFAEIGLSHSCAPGPAGGWYPPYCYTQYRVAVIDAFGGFGASSQFQIYGAHVVHYIPVHTSTLAFSIDEARTGGVLPETRLICYAALHAYPEPFCGTDGQLFQAQYRIRDAADQPFKITFFTETGAERTRGGTQFFAPSNFIWHADSGVELHIKGVQIDLARGNGGYRLMLGLQAQSY